MTTVLFVAIFLTVSLVTLGVFASLQRRYASTEYKVQKRLSAYVKENKVDEGVLPFIIRDDGLSQISFINRILQKLNFTKNLRKMLEQSGLNINVGKLLLLMIFLGSTGILIVSKVQTSLIIKICVIIFLIVLPIIYVQNRRQRRLRAFIWAFPDAVDMMTSALKAGHAFSKALHLVANEAPDPVGVEFRRAYEENNLGLPLRDALMHMTERIDSLDLKLFITAVLLQRETGGNLVEILQKISYTIRERFRLIGQIKIYTAQGRMTTWVLGALPLFLLVVLTMINPEYTAPLFNEKIGRILIIICIVMQTTGILIIRNIVKIKFQ